MATRIGRSCMPWGGDQNTFGDEVAATTVERVFRLVREGRQIDDLEAYVATAARSIAIDLSRQLAREKRREWQPESDDVTPPELTRIAVESHGRLERREDVAEALALLRQSGRFGHRRAQIIELVYLAGYTNAEIADHLGCTERTVERDRAAAYDFLRDILNDPAASTDDDGTEEP